MKNLIWFQVAMTVFATVVIGGASSVAGGLSFAGGAGLTLFNFVLLVFVWPRLLAQKQIALATAIIIFKFLILGWILYLVAHAPNVRIGWFALGLATVFPSILFAGWSLQSLSPDAERTETQSFASEPPVSNRN